MNQQEVLTDKKREGRCSGVLNACEIHFFWLYRSVGFEGNITYTKKVVRQQDNAFTLQISLSLCDKYILPTLQVYFIRSIAH